MSAAASGRIGSRGRLVTPTFAAGALATVAVLLDVGLVLMRIPAHQNELANFAQEILTGPLLAVLGLLNCRERRPRTRPAIPLAHRRPLMIAKTLRSAETLRALRTQSLRDHGPNARWPLALSVAARQSVLDNSIQNLASSLPYAAVGIVVIRRLPRNPVGWLLAGIGTPSIVATDAGSYALLAHQAGARLPLGLTAAWLGESYRPVAVLLPLAILLFPDGRLPSARWRWVLRGYLVFSASYVLVLIAWAVSAATRGGQIDSSGGLTAIDQPHGCKTPPTPTRSGPTSSAPSTTPSNPPTYPSGPPGRPDDDAQRRQTEREGNPTMTMYLVKFSYSADSWARMLANPEDRREALAPLFEAAGGELHGLWYAFGDADGYVLAEMPDAGTAAATLARVVAAGAGTVSTTVLVTVEEMLEALHRGIGSGYRAPGVAPAG